MLWVNMGGHRSLLMVMVWVWIQIRRKMLGSGVFTLLLGKWVWWDFSHSRKQLECCGRTWNDGRMQGRKEGGRPKLGRRGTGSPPPQADEDEAHHKWRSSVLSHPDDARTSIKICTKVPLRWRWSRPRNPGAKKLQLGTPWVEWGRKKVRPKAAVCSLFALGPLPSFCLRNLAY
jgi:hypothetical protein